MYASLTPSTWANVPADLHNLAPAPGFSSILCTDVPAAIFLSFMELPIFISVFSEDMIVSPTLRSVGAIIYSFGLSS